MRQLQHCIERAVALHTGGPMDSGHLFPDSAPGAARAALAGDEDSDRDLGYQDARAAFERDYLRRLLHATEGNVAKAARLSGIPRQNLYVKAKRWGLSLKEDT